MPNHIIWQDFRNGGNGIKYIYMYAGDGIGDNSDICSYVYDPKSDWTDINNVQHYDEQPDYDLDGIGDACDACPDVKDNITPCTIDSDSDEMRDSFELFYGLDIDNDDTLDDLDNDGMTNIQEFNAGTNPINNDTDGDEIMDGDDNCPLNLPAKIVSSANYTTLQDAYNNAPNGSIIQSQETTLNGDLNINRDISVTIEGGYNCDYTSVTGKTSLKGMITISNGQLNGKNLELIQ